MAHDQAKIEQLLYKQVVYGDRTFFEPLDEWQDADEKRKAIRSLFNCWNLLGEMDDHEYRRLEDQAKNATSLITLIEQLISSNHITEHFKLFERKYYALYQLRLFEYRRIKQMLQGVDPVLDVPPSPDPMPTEPQNSVDSEGDSVMSKGPSQADSGRGAGGGDGRHGASSSVVAVANQRGSAEHEPITSPGVGSGMPRVGAQELAISSVLGGRPHPPPFTGLAQHRLAAHAAPQTQASRQGVPQSPFLETPMRIPGSNVLGDDQPGTSAAGGRGRQHMMLPLQLPQSAAYRDQPAHGPMAAHVAPEKSLSAGTLAQIALMEETPPDELRRMHEGGQLRDLIHRQQPPSVPPAPPVAQPVGERMMSELLVDTDRPPEAIAIQQLMHYVPLNSIRSLSYAEPALNIGGSSGHTEIRLNQLGCWGWYSMQQPQGGFKYERCGKTHFARPWHGTNKYALIYPFDHSFEAKGGPSHRSAPDIAIFCSSACCELTRDFLLMPSMIVGGRDLYTLAV